MNNLYQQIRQASQNPLFKGNLGQVKQLMNLCKTANDPQAMLYSMMQQNPQVRSVMNLVQQSGGDPKTAFYKLAEQKGVDPEEILNALK